MARAFAEIAFTDSVKATQSRNGSRRAYQKFDMDPERGDRLTEREIEILEWVAGGYSNQGIARELAISTRTVERHIGNVYLKIGAHNRAQATAYAIRKGLVSGVDVRSVS